MISNIPISQMSKQKLRSPLRGHESRKRACSFATMSRRHILQQPDISRTHKSSEKPRQQLPEPEQGRLSTDPSPMDEGRGPPSSRESLREIQQDPEDRAHCQTQAAPPPPQHALPQGSAYLPFQPPAAALCPVRLSLCSQDPVASRAV